MLDFQCGWWRHRSTCSNVIRCDSSFEFAHVITAATTYIVLRVFFEKKTHARHIIDIIFGLGCPNAPPRQTRRLDIRTTGRNMQMLLTRLPWLRHPQRVKRRRRARRPAMGVAALRREIISWRRGRSACASDQRPKG